MRLSKFLSAALVAAGAAAAFTSAVAVDITGAGATFPYPIYAKWAEEYKKATGNGLNYQSIGSGGGTRRAVGRRCVIGRRCQDGSRGGAHPSSSSGSSPRASTPTRDR